MDRISELPCFIIHKIMSRLSAKEVTRTSVLSKKWNDIQKSFPVLDMDLNEFICRRYREGREPRKPVLEFINYVDASLCWFCEKKLSIQTFRLSIHPLFFKDLPQIIDQWIAVAVEREMKELNVNFYPGKNIMYTLPETIYSAKSITTLKLSCCEFKQPSDIIRFYSLTKISLTRVWLTQEILKKLCNECPLLEYLSLSQCIGLKCICVSNPLKLKFLKINRDTAEFEKIEIVAPNLQKLELQQDLNGEPCVIDVAVCPILKDLVLIGVNLMNHELHNFISKFPALENLFVYYSPIEKVLISSNQIKNLRLAFCSYLRVIDLDTPNLLSLVYEQNPLLPPSINIPCPWKVEFDCKYDVNISWFRNLKEFLGTAKQIEGLSLVLHPNKLLFTVRELRESSCSLPLEVGNLSLSGNVEPSSYATLLDSIFWICSPKILSIFISLRKKNQFYKWLYENLSSGDKSCCKSHHIKCWRHFLKDEITWSFFPAHPKGKPLNLQNLGDDCPDLPPGKLEFYLDWLLHAPSETVLDEVVLC